MSPVRYVAILCALLLGGCAATPTFAPTTEPRCLSACGCDGMEVLELEYFGAAGFRVRRGDDELLLGPFFSNVGLWRASPLGWGLESKPDVIHQYLGDVSGTDAILVGHSHYDHLLDVPHIAAHDATSARVYVNETGAHILAAEPALAGRVVPVNEKAWSDGDGDPADHWIPIEGTRMRVLALRSHHAPQVLGLSFMTGRVEADLAHLPRRSSGWKGGQTHAFLIDFLSSAGQVDYRIFYQDSATNFRVGMPPPSAGTVDLALACVASYSQVQGHPETLARDVAPTHWLLGHWEDFLQEYTQDPARLRSVALTDVTGFVQRLHIAGVAAERVTLPLPGQRFRLQRCP